MENVKPQNFSEARDAIVRAAQDGAPDFAKVARQVGEQAGAALSVASTTAAEYYENGKRYVRTNPAQAVATAAAVGMIAGSLITLAMRRHH